MAKIPLSAKHKSKTFESYPKLKLATGEKARICLIDQDPDVVYVHTYRMPVVVNGEVQRKTLDGKRGPYEVDVTEYVGQWACTGDYETVSTKELDAANCPQCAKVLEFPSMFSPPTRRFGQHVIRYKTAPGSYNLSKPFQAELLAWVYAESRYDELADLAEDHGEMRLKDLNINCISGDFQNYQISVAADCQWVQDDARKAFVSDIYKNNKAPSIENLIGRPATEAGLALDFDKVIGRHSLIGKTGSDFADETVALGDADLDNMFSSTPKTAAPDFATETPAASTGDVTASADVDTEGDDDESEDALKGFDDFLKSI